MSTNEADNSVSAGAAGIATGASSDASTDPSPGAEDTKSNFEFPLNAKVVLTGLKTAEFNGKQGIVKSSISADGRYQVLVGKKFLGLKPANLNYDKSKPLTSLSVTELKSILEERNESGEALNLTGMDVSDLKRHVSAMHEEQAFHLLAIANAKKELQKQEARALEEAQKKRAQAEHMKQQADQIGNLNPEQLRQQARAMRSLPPDHIRRMNPQLAHMSDAQIRAAADQMEQMANNPEMLRMAANQVKNMSPEELQRAQQEEMRGGAVPSTAAASGYGTRTAAPQQQQAMTPEALKQQAQMMRTMSKEQIRQLNPQLANMTDAQIDQSIVQMEQIADNPQMLKMAQEQVKNMSPEELARMQSDPNAAAEYMMKNNSSNPDLQDPSKMLEQMDAKQLKHMMELLKKNPDMIKSMLPAGTDSTKLMQSLKMFDGMTDQQLESTLAMMKGVQKVTAPIRNVYQKINSTCCGGYLMTVVGLFMLAYIGLFFYLRFVVAPNSTNLDVAKAATMNSVPEPVVPDVGDTEF